MIIQRISRTVQRKHVLIKVERIKGREIELART